MSANLNGAILMMGSMLAFTVNDALVKLAGAQVPLFQLVTLRGALTCLCLCLLAWRLGALRWRLAPRDRALLVIRCLAELLTTYFFLNALLRMPLANVTAVLQALPLTVSLGAALVFGEPLGWRRLLAIALGFVGVMLIVRPGPDGFDAYAGFALAAVFCVTLRDLVTRRISAAVPSLTVALATAVSVTVAAALASTTDDWVRLTPALSGLIAGASLFILAGYLLSVMVMRTGDVSFIAPFRYTSLVWALILGVLLFGHWPDPVTLLGALIVVATGLFTLYRERAALVRQ